MPRPGRASATRRPVEAFVTHRFGLQDMLAAYDTFGDAARTKALKVAIAR